MKAICVTAERKLEVRDIPPPAAPPAEHLVVHMNACAINHGDITFLSRPDAAGNVVPLRHDTWGASGAGTVIAVGSGVPTGFEGRKVAIYRSLARTPDTVGLWCETAQVHYSSCLLLPESVSARDYCGSLVNVFTAYAFLEQLASEGHQGVIATAGNSATGLAIAALARRRGLPSISLVRSAAARDGMRRLGVEHVVNTADEGFEKGLGELAARLGTTAVFDGVGGDLISRIAPMLPMNTSISFYGFLSATAPVSLSTYVFMAKNLTLKRFSNFESATARDRSRLSAAFADLQGCIADPMFHTRIGREFSFDHIDKAMAYRDSGGRKAVLVP